MKKIIFIISMLIVFSSCTIANVNMGDRIDSYLPPGSTDVKFEKSRWWSFTNGEKQWYIFIDENGYGDTVAFFPKN